MNNWAELFYCFYSNVLFLDVICFVFVVSYRGGALA